MQPATTGIFAQAGTYAVSLQVSNPAGSHIYIDSVTILGHPTANFEYQVTGNQVKFTNLSANATSYDWDFGDNTGTYHPVHPDYHYNQNATYPVRLIAKNSCGSDTIVLNIEISAPPITSYIAITQSCEAPFSIHYIDNSFNSPTSWIWEFEGGNPTTSTEESPYVSYAVAGTYQIKHIAINDYGADTLIEEVFINGHQNEFLNQTLCQGDSLVISGFVFDEDNPTGEIQLINATGCDTILHVSLSFEASQNVNIVDSMAIGATYTVGGSTYSAAGSYTDSLTTINGCDSIVHLELTIFDPTGTQELSNIHSLSYYPNPVTDWIYFSFELSQKAIVRVEIYDISGKRMAIISEKSLLPGKHELSHNMGKAASGVYFAKVITGSDVWTVRFVK